MRYGDEQMPSHWGGAKEMASHRKKRDEEELAAILEMISDKSPPPGDDSIQEAPLQFDDMVPMGALAKGAGAAGLALGALKDKRLSSWLRNMGVKDHILDLPPKEFLSQLNEAVDARSLHALRKELHVMNGVRAQDMLNFEPKNTYQRSQAAQALADIYGVKSPWKYTEDAGYPGYLGWFQRNGRGENRIVNLNASDTASAFDADQLAEANLGVINHEIGHLYDHDRLGEAAYDSFREGEIPTPKFLSLKPTLQKEFPGMDDQQLDMRARIFTAMNHRDNPWLATRIYSQGHHQTLPQGFDAHFSQWSLAKEALDEGRLVHPAILDEHPDLARKAGKTPKPEQDPWKQAKLLRPHNVKETPPGKLPRAAFRDENGHVWRQRDTGWISVIVKDPKTPPEQREHLKKILDKLNELRDFSEGFDPAE